MNDKSPIALSSLAVSASTAALLGMSGLAKGDGLESCAVGNACSLGYWSYFQGFNPGVPWHQIPSIYWYSVEQAIEGFVSQYGTGGYWPTGTCVFTQLPLSNNPTCACQGYAMGFEGQVSWDPPNLTILPNFVGKTIYVAGQQNGQCYY